MDLDVKETRERCLADCKAFACSDVNQKTKTDISTKKKFDVQNVTASDTLEEENSSGNKVAVKQLSECSNDHLEEYGKNVNPRISLQTVGPFSDLKITSAYSLSDGNWDDSAKMVSTPVKNVTSAATALERMLNLNRENISDSRPFENLNFKLAIMLKSKCKNADIFASYHCHNESCYFTTNDISLLKDHLDVCCVKENMHVCYGCGHQSSNDTFLQKHLVVHLKDSSCLLFNCSFSQCVFGSNVLQEFTNHSIIYHFKTLADIVGHFYSNSVRHIQKESKLPKQNSKKGNSLHSQQCDSSDRIIETLFSNSSFSRKETCTGVPQSDRPCGKDCMADLDEANFKTCESSSVSTNIETYKPDSSKINMEKCKLHFDGMFTESIKSQIGGFLEIGKPQLDKTHSGNLNEMYAKKGKSKFFGANRNFKSKIMGSGELPVVAVSNSYVPLSVTVDSERYLPRQDVAEHSSSMLLPGELQNANCQSDSGVNKNDVPLPGEKSISGTAKGGYKQQLVFVKHESGRNKSVESEKNETAKGNCGPVSDESDVLQMSNFCFYCRWCDFATNNLQLFKKHEHRDHIAKNKKPVVQVESSQSNTASSLLLKQHEFVEKLQCPFCDISFDMLRKFRCHILSEHKDCHSLKMYACRCCHMKSTSKKYVKQHVSQMHPRRFSKAISIIESFTEKDVYPRKKKYATTTIQNFSGKKELKKMHAVQKYSSKSSVLLKKFPCQLCVFSTNDMTTLKHHMLLVHNYSQSNNQVQINNFHCELCEFSTHDIAGLKKHFLSMHMYNCHKSKIVSSLQINNFHCELCEFSTSDLAGLKKHLSLSHTSSTQLAAHQIDNFCLEFSASDKSDLNTHLMSKHVQEINNQSTAGSGIQVGNFHCELCKFSTIDRDMLKKHLRQYHKDNCSQSASVVNLHCELCEFTASDITTLKKHFAEAHMDCQLMPALSFSKACAVQQENNLSAPVTNKHKNNSADNLGRPELIAKHHQSSCASNVNKNHNSSSSIENPQNKCLIEIVPIKPGDHFQESLRCPECIFATIDSMEFWNHLKTHPGLIVSIGSGIAEPILSGDSFHSAAAAESLLAQGHENQRSFDDGYPRLGEYYFIDKLINFYSMSGKYKTCKFCKYSTLEYYHIHRHLLCRHLKVNFWKCGHCSLEKLNKYEVIRHSLLCHVNEPISAHILSEPDWAHIIAEAKRGPMHLRKLNQLNRQKIKRARKISKVMKCKQQQQQKLSFDTPPFHVIRLANNIYKCSGCIVRSFDEDKVRQHIIKHHLTAGQIPPSNTDLQYTLNQNKNLSIVAEVIKNSNNSEFKCGFCTYSSIVETDVKNHIWASHFTLLLDKIPPESLKMAQTRKVKAVSKKSTHLPKKVNDKNAKFSMSSNGMYECSRCKFSCSDEPMMRLHFQRHSCKSTPPEIDRKKKPYLPLQQYVLPATDKSDQFIFKENTGDERVNNLNDIPDDNIPLIYLQRILHSQDVGADALKTASSMDKEANKNGNYGGVPGKDDFSANYDSDHTNKEHSYAVNLKAKKPVPKDTSKNLKSGADEQRVQEKGTSKNSNGKCVENEASDAEYVDNSYQAEESVAVNDFIQEVTNDNISEKSIIDSIPKNTVSRNNISEKSIKDNIFKNIVSRNDNIPKESINGSSTEGSMDKCISENTSKNDSFSIVENNVSENLLDGTGNKDAFVDEHLLDVSAGCDCNIVSVKEVRESSQAETVLKDTSGASMQSYGLESYRVSELSSTLQNSNTLEKSCKKMSRDIVFQNLSTSENGPVMSGNFFSIDKEIHEVESDLEQTGTSKQEPLVKKSEKEGISSSIDNIRTAVVDSWTSFSEDKAFEESTLIIREECQDESQNAVITGDRNPNQELDIFVSEVNKSKWISSFKKSKKKLELIEQHIQFSVHSEAYVCSVCSCENHSLKAARKHVWTVHLNSDSARQLDFLYDDASWLDDGLYRPVITMHPDVYDSTLTDEEMMIKAKKLIQTTADGFQCLICNYVNNSYNHIKKHVWSVHMYLRRKKCSMCRFKSWFHAILKQHFESVHAVSSRSKMKRHSKLSRSSVYEKLILKLSNGTSVCCRCVASLESESAMWNHLKDYHGFQDANEVSSFKFFTRKCSRSFQQAVSSRSWYLSTSGEKRSRSGRTLLHHKRLLNESQKNRINGPTDLETNVQNEIIDGKKLSEGKSKKGLNSSKSAEYLYSFNDSGSSCFTKLKDVLYIDDSQVLKFDMKKSESRTCWSTNREEHLENVKTKELNFCKKFSISEDKRKLFVEQFASSTAFRKHMQATDEQMILIMKKIVCTKSGLFRCPFCQLKNTSHAAVRRHIWKEHMCLEPGSCLFCTYESWFACVLHSHQKEHAENLCDPQKSSCKKSTANSNDDDCLAQRRKTVQTRKSDTRIQEPEAKQLKDCSLGIKSLKNHMSFSQEKCTDSSEIQIVTDFRTLGVKTFSGNRYKSYRCTLCSSDVQSEMDFWNHCQQHGDVFECSSCPYRSQSRSALVKHVTEHKAAHMLVLHNVMMSDNLVEEQESSEEEPEVPSRELMRMYDEETDSCMSSKQRETLKYLCPSCSLKTKDFSMFTKHLGLHSMHLAEDGLSCNYCRYRTKDVSELETHITNHLMARPFHCKYCGFLGLESRDIHKHIHRIHSDKPLLIGEHCTNIDGEMIITPIWPAVNFDVVVKVKDFFSLDCKEFHTFISS